MSLVGFKSSNHPQQVGKRGATERDNLGTDPALFERLNERFGFTLDAAASKANAKCDRFFTLEDDGLAQSWAEERVWCNPPYSEIVRWVRKAGDEVHAFEPHVRADGSVTYAFCRWCAPFSGDEGQCPGGYGQPRADLVVMLLPANRTEQGWWQDYVEPLRDRPDSPLRVEFLRGRQRFVLPGAESIGPNERPPFGCCLLIWSRDGAA